MRFLDLLRPDPKDLPWELQQRAARMFPDALAQSKLRAWKRGDPIVSSGKRILLGVGAAYSLPDLALLDILNEAPDLAVQIDVFDVSVCTSAAEYDEYIPGISAWPTTPTIGVWDNGHLVQLGGNMQAFSVLSQLLGLSWDELLKMVLKRAQTPGMGMVLVKNPVSGKLERVE